MIGGADVSSILPGDFVLPSEEPTMSETLFVNLTSLDLAVTDDSYSMTGTPASATDIDYAPQIMTYSAMMRFSIDADGEDKREVNLELKHNVNFVTAYPCVTSPDALKLTNLGNIFDGPGSPAKSPRDFTGMYDCICNTDLLTINRSSTTQSIHIYQIPSLISALLPATNNRISFITTPITDRCSTL